MTVKFDFQAWLKTKPDDEPYNYYDSCGNCAVGQFMTSRGEEWNYARYSQIASEVCGGYHTALRESETFGALKQRILETV